jgi:hypothetical protein
MSQETPGRDRRASRAGVWLRKCSSFEEENQADLEFWQRMTPNERVALVEQIRAEWWERNGDGEQGLRRAVRVLEQT